jgi:hypothetical protein
MKSRLLIVACALSAFCMVGVSPAAATVFLQSDATSIVAGQSITFLFAPPPGDAPFQTVYTGGDQILEGFAGGGVTYNSGDGQVALTSYGTAVTFTYLIPGNYVASATAQMYYHTVVCGFSFGPGVCEPMPNGQPLWFPGASELISVSVPEPATWLLLLLGFAGLCFAFRRSRRRASFA